MSNQLSTFSFEDTPIRVLNKGGEPWFIAKDVCDVLELTNSRKAISALDDDEKGVTLTYTLRGQQEVNIINESGLYILILRSRKAMQKGTPQYRFRKWVTAEVLPTIRKTGSYQTPKRSKRALPNRTLSDREIAEWANIVACAQSMCLLLEHLQTPLRRLGSCYAAEVSSWATLPRVLIVRNQRSLLKARAQMTDPEYIAQLDNAFAKMM